MEHQRQSAEWIYACKYQRNGRVDRVDTFRDVLERLDALKYRNAFQFEALTLHVDPLFR